MTPGESDFQKTHYPSRRGDIVVHELDDEAVLYDERSGAVHRFNQTALAVWKACDGSRNISELSRDLAKRYALGSEQAHTEVENVIRNFEAKSLLNASCKPATQPASRLPSRREVLRGGTAKLIYTAPLISTFIASGACASGPSASGAFGTDDNGGCKEVGYSCGVNNDCCQDPAKTKCDSQSNSCCCQHNESCCTLDTECCNSNDTCNAGTCN